MSETGCEHCWHILLRGHGDKASDFPPMESYFHGSKKIGEVCCFCGVSKP